MVRKLVHFFLLLTVASLLSGIVVAGEQKLMHCFYFTPIAEATQDDWTAFDKASDELPDKIPGLNKVWRGKLRRPFNAYNSEGAKRVREHGVCMELDDEDALDVYADHPAHTEWIKVYEKVRQRGTSTFDILGE